MAFIIDNLIRNGLEVIRLKEDTTQTQVAMLPAYGGMLNGFTIQHNGKLLNILDHYENKAQLSQELALSFKNAKLSPFACRVKDGTYTFRGKPYRIVKRVANGEALHGLLYDAPFQVKSADCSDDKAEVVLHFDYSGEDEGFPFPYRCELKYTLSHGNKLTLATTLHNLGTNPIPVMDGWHPYFTTGSTVNNLLLQFNARQIAEFDETLIPTGKLLPYDTFSQLKKIGDTILNNSFILDFEQPQPACVLKDEQQRITIEIFPDESYPVLQLYIPDDRSSIAIENLSALPDTFNNGIGLQAIMPASSLNFTTSIVVKND